MKKMIVFTGLLIFFGACSHNTDKKAQLDKLKKQHDEITLQIQQLEKELNPQGSVIATPVSITVIKKTPFEHYIEVQGRVDGNENIGVSPRSVGVVNKIFVNEGDFVKKGQLLAELDAQVFKQNLNELQSQLKFANDLYLKQKNLWDQNIGSEVQYLTAKNNKESLENKISTIQDQINMSNITSPIDGTVEDIPIKVGQMATAGTPAFRVINFLKAKVVADVGEAYSSKIKTGDHVQVFLPDFNEVLEQKVTFASKYINPTNRTFTVEAELPSEQNVYRANMIAVVRVKDYMSPSCIAVPQNYIQSSKNEGTFVFIVKVENGKKLARKAFVKAGISYNGLTEITEGLKEGDTLITAGYKDLYEGQTISF
jgi:RND family efflux transporter MFP subunit